MPESQRTVPVRAPRQQVGTVGVDARGELRVEDKVARRAELREIRQRAPAHDKVAAVGRLGLPCDGAMKPSGWLSDLIGVAVWCHSLSLTVMARL